MKYRFNLFLTVFWAIILPISLALTALETPSYNFDLVGYVASVYIASTKEPNKLQELTYADIKSFVPPRNFTQLTADKDYQERVYADAIALKQLVPFYAIRHAYVGLISFASSFSLNASKATYLISAIFAACSLVMIFLLFKHFNISLYLIPFIVYPIGLMEVASLASPDSMALFFALLIFYLWLQPSKILFYLSLFLCTLIPLVRTDYVIFSLLVFLYTLKSEKRIAIVGVVLSLASFWLAGKLAHGYGYLTLFNHQFIRLLVYPETSSLSTHLVDYVKGYLFSIRASISNIQTLLYIFTTYWLLINAKNKLTILQSPQLGVPYLFVVFHLALFPIFFTRHFVFSNIILFIFLVLTITKKQNGFMRPLNRPNA